jgi:hypothetical protein
MKIKEIVDILINAGIYKPEEKFKKLTENKS